MLGACLDAVRASVPLVHNITNYVTVNDVANVLLACGGNGNALSSFMFLLIFSLD